MSDSKFRDDEIRKEWKKETRSESANLEAERKQRMRELEKILERGSFQDLVDALNAVKKGPGTPEGDALIAYFRRRRGF